MKALRVVRQVRLRKGLTCGTVFRYLGVLWYRVSFIVRSSGALLERQGFFSCPRAVWATKGAQEAPPPK